jgi:16S rRNA (adenine1518-N6/adenine1519-N6)-dimethyltransferase
MTRPLDALREQGLAAIRGRSQNFLRDPNIARRVAELVVSEKPEDAWVLEIGPGLGAITRPLLDLGSEVCAVELDRGLAGGLRKWPEAASGRLKVIEADVLAIDPASGLPPGGCVVCGNLPYSVSTPVLFWFLAGFRNTAGVFMLQKELAARLRAAPGTKEYGRLAVGLGLWFGISTPFDIGPQAFQPRPRVTSSMAVLRPRPDPPGLDPGEFAAFTRACFHSRRKTLMNNLLAAWPRPKIEAALGELGVDPGLRPESLSPAQFAALFRALGGPLGG